MEKPVLSWTCEDVGVWLDDIGLNKFKEQFLCKLILSLHFVHIQSGVCIF